jgi:hypothetical protein
VRSAPVPRSGRRLTLVARSRRAHTSQAATGAGVLGNDGTNPVRSVEGRVLQVDRTTHGFVAGVQPAKNINPGGAAADLARDVAGTSAAGKQHWTQSELSYASSSGTSGQRALFGQRETKFFRAKSAAKQRRPNTAGGGGNDLRSRSMHAEGTWNDFHAGQRGTGSGSVDAAGRRPASASGISAQLSYCQEHHPFERSFQYAPAASATHEESFWGESVNPALASHPGIEDQDMPTFGFGGPGQGGQLSHRPPSPPFSSHHHQRVKGYGDYESPHSPVSGQFTSSFVEAAAAAGVSGVYEAGAAQNNGGGIESQPSWMEEMSLMSSEAFADDEVNNGSSGPMGEAEELSQIWLSSSALSDDVRQRAFDRREKSYVDVLGQRPMPIDERVGVTAWGAAHPKEIYDDHNPALKQEDMRRREEDVLEGRRRRIAMDSRYMEQTQLRRAAQRKAAQRKAQRAAAAAMGRGEPFAIRRGKAGQWSSGFMPVQANA